MNLEEFEKAWRAQDTTKTISINADLLLCEVRRNQQQFRTTIFLRDLREVGVALLLVPVFIAMGIFLHNWTNFLVAAACLLVGGFILVDRARQRKNSPEPGGTLSSCVAASLAEVRHQIWLLRNILWWYLLPLFIPIVISMCWPKWRAEGFRMNLDDLGLLLGAGGGVALVYGFLYWLNQLAVKKQLQPREAELEKLLHELGTENIAANPGRPFGPFLLVLLMSGAALFAQSVNTTNSPAHSTRATGIARIREEHNLPALAVVVTKDGRLCDIAAAGVRKWGDTTPVTTNDLFHIGSCTKSMTATLAAILIDEGKLRWDTTIGEMFPELKGKMDKRYEAVTVEQLLHNRGGVPHSPPAAAWERAWKEIGTLAEQRREFVEAVLAAPPEAEPGTKMIYSNDGFVIVGLMLEKISGQDLEALMTAKLFKPLHMDSAGFGVPGTSDKVDQPWGHVEVSHVPSPTQVDNPPVYTACGRVHCSLEDLARYTMFHLQSTNSLLKPETMARLHASAAHAEIKDVMDDYACGWVRLKRKWAGGTVLWHNGSNTMWYTVMWVAPQKNFSLVVACNMAGPDAEKACNDAAVAMIDKWLPK